jgi:PKD repeat protein
MKLSVLLFLLIATSKSICASPIIGGEMYYTYVGKGVSATSHVYKITLKLYREKNNENFEYLLPITIFRSLTGASIAGPVYTKNYAVLEGPFQVNYFSADPCVSPPEDVSFQYGLYSVTVDLQESSYGYIAAYQRCCRDTSVINLEKPGEQGATYFTKIPGRINSTSPLSVINSSPRFSNNDSALVCRFSKFKIDFSAVDADGDNLTYQFVAARRGGGNEKDGLKCNYFRPDPACFPFDNCIYKKGFSETSPMGPGITINPSTGIISGIAPDAGKYVIAVLCYEIRGTIIIGFHYKELLITVSASCSAITAQLNSMPVNCDSFTVHFKNDAVNAGLNANYFWDFGEPSSGVSNTSLLTTPAHTYITAGDYKVKLKVSLNGNCTDSAETIIKVYPGFRPDFDILGQCKNTPIQFIDKTQADFGNITKWEWDLGDWGGQNNTSSLQSPTHVYFYPNDYTVTLKAQSSKGCVASVSKPFKIKNTPLFQVFPKDTLICTVDTLQINVVGTGIVRWKPAYMIDNVISPTPLMSPDVTTTYKISFTDAFGCTATDSIKINVTNGIQLFVKTIL